MINNFNKLISLFKRCYQGSWYVGKPLWLFGTGSLALVIYALTRMTLDDLGRPAEYVFVFLGLTAWLIYGGESRKSSIIWLVIAAIAIPLLSWGGALLHHPQWAENSPKVHRLTQWFVFVPIAVWLGGRTKNTFVLWGIAVFGLLLAPWLTGHGWLELQQGLKGGRVDFGLHNAQHAGMLYASAFLGLIAFSRRVFNFNAQGYWLYRLLWFVVLVACCFGILVTQTRGVFLGLFGAGLCLFVLSVWSLWRGSYRKNVYNMGIASLIVILIFVFLASPVASPFKKSIERRFLKGSVEIEKFFGGSIDDLSYSNVGARVHTWIEAWPWIQERPIVGWGGNGRGLIFEHSKNLPERIKQNFGHLHNSYLDILVNYGVLGLFLFLCLLVWLVKKSVYAWKFGTMPGDMLVLLLSFLFFWLIVNCFESYMFFSSGSFVFSLICGGVLTHIWKYESECSR